MYQENTQIMTTRFIYFILFCLSFIWSACEKHNYADGVLSPITSIEDVRSLYKGTDVVLTKQNMMGAHQITGVVISDPANGNAPSGVIILQQTRRKKTRGISIPLESALDYQAGDSLLLNIEGAVLKRVSGSLQITGLSDASIQKISSDNPAAVQSVSSLTINARPGDYESTLVQVKSGIISPEPAFGDTFAGDKLIVNGAESISLHTEAAASIASSPIPASASFSGILVVHQSASDVSPVLQIWPRSINDITDIIAPPDPNAELGENAVLITGYINDTKGADGNYEYFQFRATEDIDFEKTPMAVLTCTNAGTATPNAGAAPAEGWATGGGRTYKFNLTSGTVAKGDFFYVGGSNKRINGPNTTDISSAKWIKTIAYTTNDGDGIGLKSSGLLPNSGNAGGIAIFDGINVTESSIPMDAVFFGGTSKTTIFDAVNLRGYRIPNNDHYSIVDAASVQQPFFFQGTNQYIIPHITPTDLGAFVKLGGTFDLSANTWTTARGHVFYTLSATSELSEIQTGSDVTVLAD